MVIHGGLNISREKFFSDLWVSVLPPEMCSGSEAGSYSRLMDFVYHSTLGLRVIQRKSQTVGEEAFDHVLDALPAVLGEQRPQVR